MNKSNLFLWPALVAAGFALTGCGGGSSSVSSGSAGTAPPGGPAFSLGGSVSGLVNGASVLLFDGVQPKSNSVSVVAASTVGISTAFSFEGGAAYLGTGSAYDVTVQQQPTGGKCSIANGAATVSMGNVSNVAVNCLVPTANVLVEWADYPAALGNSSPYLVRSIAVDGNGNVYSADRLTGNLLKTTSTGSITVLLLTDAVTGKAITSPAINLVALDSNGMIYVAATSSGGGSVIQTISETNIVTTLAGSGALGSNDGAGVSASFGDVIKGLAIDSAGNVYVADSNSSLSNNKIRKITRAGLVSTLAGSGAQGAADGAGSAASFNMGGSSGNALAVDSNFNVYLVEWPNADVRKITPAGVVSTFAGGGGRFGGADGVGATVASFANPFGITIDGAGNLYVLDGSNAIRMITPIGMVSTLVPGGVSVFAPDNTVVNQGGNSMTCIASATDGTLYAGNGVFIDSMWHSDIIKVSFH